MQSLRSDSAPAAPHIVSITAGKEGQPDTYRRYNLKDPANTTDEVSFEGGLDKGDVEILRRSPPQLFKEFEARDEADRKAEAHRKQVEEESKFLNRVKKAMLSRGFTESDFADLCREVYIQPVVAVTGATNIVGTAVPQLK